MSNSVHTTTWGNYTKVLSVRDLADNLGFVIHYNSDGFYITPKEDSYPEFTRDASMARVETVEALLAWLHGWAAREDYARLGEKKPGVVKSRKSK
jgi:hypothetical protein